MTVRIYTVWGPTAEWGDGSGPLFYTDSLKAAASYVRQERKDAIERAADIDPSFASAAPEGIRADYERACAIIGWPMNHRPFTVECEEWDTAEEASRFFSRSDPPLTTLEELLEDLNEGW